MPLCAPSCVIHRLTPPDHLWQVPWAPPQSRANSRSNQATILSLVDAQSKPLEKVLQHSFSSAFIIGGLVITSIDINDRNPTLSRGNNKEDTLLMQLRSSRGHPRCANVVRNQLLPTSQVSFPCCWINLKHILTRLVLSCPVFISHLLSSSNLKYVYKPLVPAKVYKLFLGLESSGFDCLPFLDIMFLDKGVLCSCWQARGMCLQGLECGICSTISTRSEAGKGKEREHDYPRKKKYVWQAKTKDTRSRKGNTKDLPGYGILDEHSTSSHPSMERALSFAQPSFTKFSEECK